MSDETRDELTPEGLERLRSAWRGVAPRELPDELDDADALTQRTVEWMRAAWEGLEVPECRVSRPPSPAQLAAPSIRSVRSRPHRLRVLSLAAAVILALFLAFALNRLQRSLDPARPLIERGEGTGLPVARPEPAGSALPDLPDLPDLSGGAQVASVSPEHIELRSGPVRLILLEPPRTSENLGERR